MKRSVFLVANPTHYINALEIIKHFKGRFGHKVLIVVSEYIDGINNVDKILKSDFWDEKHIIDLREYPWPASDYRTWKKCYQEAKAIMKQAPMEYCVTGNLRDTIFYALAQNLKGSINNCIALDDGTPSISILNSRAAQKDYQRYHFRSFRVLLKSLISLNTVFPFYKPFERLEFFTIFHLPAGSKDTVVKNELSIIGNLYSQNEMDQNLVYFIGSHIVDKGLVNKDVYLSFLKRISEKYKSEGRKMLYITHRGESKEMLDEIVKIVHLTSFDVPLEFALIDKNLPAEISGFFSSALFTLRKIHSPDLKIKAYKFKEKDILGSEQETQQDILSIYHALNADQEIQLISENI